MRLISRTLDQIHSPIGAAHALVPLRTNDRPLLDLSQAAPSCPPPDNVVARIAEVAREPDGARYAPQPGLPHLRERFAAELSGAYEAELSASNVLVTAGCNQAFCLVASALAMTGDEVLLPVPYYFNHDMWLKLDGIVPAYVPTTDGVLDPDAVERAVTDRTRAVVLVSPGNPTGVTASAEVIEACADIARRHDIVLVLDETYRSFRPSDGPAHGLFGQDGWADHVVSLHSFSKEFAIPGYRVGAIVGHPELLAEAMKLLDCVTICTPRIGQEAAAEALVGSLDWRDEQVARTRELQAAFERLMQTRPGGFELRSAGAYFGWVRHPFAHRPTDDVVRRLVLDHDVLVIPGTAFTPTDQQLLRFSFANLAEHEITELGCRLDEMAS